MSEHEDICDMDLLAQELTDDEGIRAKRYRCTADKWSIGIGHNLQGKTLPPEIWTAIKRENPHVENALLDDQATISADIIFKLFGEDVFDAVTVLDTIWIGWRALSENRKRALINLSFQLGSNRLLGFVRFWRAMKHYDFAAATKELQDSLWYRQTQASRTERVIRQIKDG